MPALDDYIYAMEALDGAADGFAVGPVPRVAAVGVCGVVGSVDGAGATGVASVSGSGAWSPVGDLLAPWPDIRATTDGWHPGWGMPVAPLPMAAASGRLLSASIMPSPSPFVTGGGGAFAAVIAPVPELRIDSGLSTSGNGLCLGLLARVDALICSIDNPLAEGVAPSRIVGLLNQGSQVLAAVAKGLAEGAATNDAKAFAVLYAVSNLLDYVGDDAGIGDRWSCSVATWMRGYGDCEDGAILIHALLLAAGVAARRVRTCFGTYGIDDLGHVWCVYQRESDGAWVPLDWTVGPGAWDGSVRDLAPITELTDRYRSVDHLLTESDFYAVTTVGFSRLVTLSRARGACGPAAPEVAGTTALAGYGVVAGPAAGVRAVSGIAGCCAVPLPRGAGQGGQDSIGQGEARAPSPMAAALAGARVTAVAPPSQAAGLCGVAARAELASPCPGLTAAGGQASVGWGQCRTPVGCLAALALAGRSGAGLCPGPVPRVRCCVVPGLGARVRCAGILPRLTGQGGPVSQGHGEVVTRAPRVRAAGHGPAVWATRLWEYDPGRPV